MSCEMALKFPNLFIPTDFWKGLTFMPLDFKFVIFSSLKFVRLKKEKWKSFITFALDNERLCAIPANILFLSIIFLSRFAQNQINVLRKQQNHMHRIIENIVHRKMKSFRISFSIFALYKMNWVFLKSKLDAIFRLKSFVS